MKGFEINVEWVALQQPDLIIATYYGDLDDATYALLSQIAPTVAAPPGHPAWGAPWQEELLLIGEATGTLGKGRRDRERNRGEVRGCARRLSRAWR